MSLSIHPVWSESSLSAWRNIGPLTTHGACSKDSDQTGQLPRLIWVLAGLTSLCWFCHAVAQIMYFRSIGLVLAHYACSTHPELQQRAVEYSTLFNKFDHMRLVSFFLSTFQTFIGDCIRKWTTSSEFGTYRLCEQRRLSRTCASAQSRQNLSCLLIQAVSHEEPSDRKPDPWPLWMAGHA